MTEKLRLFLCFLYSRILHEHKKFITADPANNIIHTELALNLLCHIHNYCITKCMPEIVIDSFEIININKEQNAALIRIFFDITCNFLLYLQFIQKLCQRIPAHLFLQRLVHVDIKAAAYNANNFSFRIGHTSIIGPKPLITRCLSIFTDIKTCIHTV